MASTLNATTTNGLVTSADNSGSLQLQTNNGTTAVTVDTSQNVGIGTTSPSDTSLFTRALDLNGTSGAAFYARTNGSSTNYTLYGNFGSDGYINNRAAGNFLFYNSNAERMRIDSSGNLLVGTTSSSRTSGAGVKVIPGATPTNYIVGASSVNNDSALDVYSTGAGAYRFQIGYGGTIYATSTTITGISDQRLKENIIDLDEGLNAVMALKPRKFDWKTGKGKDIKGDRGFIAQEFEQVFPDMIEESKDPVPEGEEPYKAVNANIIPTLVKAIQEQQAQIEELKADLQALKGVA